MCHTLYPNFSFVRDGHYAYPLSSFLGSFPGICSLNNYYSDFGSMDRPCESLLGISRYDMNIKGLTLLLLLSKTTTTTNKQKHQTKTPNNNLEIKYFNKS